LPSFNLSEPEGYRRDAPNPQVYVLNVRHFALDTATDQLAAFGPGFVGSSRWEGPWRGTSAEADIRTPPTTH